MNRRALEGRGKALGKEHPSTLTSVYNLFYLLQTRHRYEDALLLYQRAFAGYQKTLGPDRPTTRACLGYYFSLQQLLDTQSTQGGRHASIDATPGCTHSESSAGQLASRPRNQWWRKLKKRRPKRRFKVERLNNQRAHS